MYSGKILKNTLIEPLTSEVRLRSIPLDNIFCIIFRKLCNVAVRVVYRDL